MRFGLRHLLAVSTLFAILLAIGSASDAIQRDGVWTLESIETEDWGGSWHGEDAVTGELIGGAILTYVATLRDGDRVRMVCVGDDFSGVPPLPKPGDSFIFTGSEMPRGKPIFPGSTIYTGPPPGSPTFFAVDDHTLVVAARTGDGYAPILNAVAAFFLSFLLVFLYTCLHRFVAWLPRAITESQERRQ
ncbi:hypothetical protein [Crateriforma conspicua]|uniref:hypothetical protein n=1 Tax=Crateriforma conspicua TaxID=2527996 RepID=UPI001188A8CE|nr:hypothetical protein [Crateriforma conspicua]QDV61071.1 hypothetical protein Mal65_01940 [Crateriforma conspicua]